MLVSHGRKAPMTLAQGPPESWGWLEMGWLEQDPTADEAMERLGGEVPAEPKD